MKFILAFLAAMIALSAGPRAQLIGVNYANGNRLSVATQAADLAAMKAAGVRTIRVPLEKFNGSYKGSTDLVKAAAAQGIATHLVIALSNADFFPPGTTKRPGDPSIFAAYRLSDLDPHKVQDALYPLLLNLEAAGVHLAGVELFNEIGNPAFNGDLLLMDAPVVLMGFDDLLAAPMAQFSLGIRRYILALALVKNALLSLTLNADVPLVSAGLNNPGDVVAGTQLAIAWQSVEADGLLYFLRLQGLDAAADQYGMHSYAWGNAAKIKQLNQTLMMRQCSPPGANLGKPCAITEWGFSVSPTQAQSATDWRADIATYGDAVASVMYFDWKGATYGIYQNSRLSAAGTTALGD